MYDIVIVGAGAAGISAAVYGVSRGKKLLVWKRIETEEIAKARELMAAGNLRIILYPPTLVPHFAKHIKLSQTWIKSYRVYRKTQ